MTTWNGTYNFQIQVHFSTHFYNISLLNYFSKPTKFQIQISLLQNCRGVNVKTVRLGHSSLIWIIEDISYPQDPHVEYNKSCAICKGPLHRAYTSAHTYLHVTALIQALCKELFPYNNWMEDTLLHDEQER